MEFIVQSFGLCTFTAYGYHYYYYLFTGYGYGFLYSAKCMESMNSEMKV